MNDTENEDVPCIKCGSGVNPFDKFCRYCGEKDPGTGFFWDWKESPPWGLVNNLLRPFGCRIEWVDTNTDQCAARVIDCRKV